MLGIHDQLVDAIRRRAVLQFSYHGHLRVVEPHTYGIDAKGHSALVAYQTGGSSSSGHTLGWRTFHVAHMRAVAALPHTFPATRHGYVPNDPAMSTIYAQL